MNRRAITTSTLALLACAGLALAGPLTPPAGPVVSSFKTLGEVEPRIAVSAVNTPGDATNLFRITQPGSYYLSGNIQGVAGKNGISIEASNVTLDLAGFNVLGVAGSLNGVLGYPASRVIVRNGTVSFWGQRGVYIGAGGAVVDVAVDHCTGTGIEATQNCRIQHCNVVGNTGSGIIVARFSTVSECLADGNGIMGIQTSGTATVERCSSAENASAGIDAAAGSAVTDCTCTLNVADGIDAADRCTITGNTCPNNGDDGIQVASACTVFRNNCSGNDPNGDGGGVYVVGNNNRVEDNLLVGNHYGILCGGLHNFIVKNTCNANTTNFNVNATNETAPIITSPGANNFVTMTSWSNVSY